MRLVGRTRSVDFGVEVAAPAGLTFTQHPRTLYHGCGTLQDSRHSSCPTNYLIFPTACVSLLDSWPRGTSHCPISVTSPRIGTCRIPIPAAFAASPDSLCSKTLDRSSHTLGFPSGSPHDKMDTSSIECELFRRESGSIRTCDRF